MNKVRVPRIWILVPLIAGLLAIVPAGLWAFSVGEISCQQTIGTASLRFAKRVHLAELHCLDAEAGGTPCDTVERDAAIFDSTQKLSARLAQKCGPVVLEPLGFAGLCPDANGAPFTETDLFNCMRDAHQQRVETALTTEYQNLPAPLAGDEKQCQRLIGNAGARFIKQKLKFRQRCRSGQMRNKIPPTVDCYAEVPPGGPGTGDADTDTRITAAATKMASQLLAACEDVTLENLTFPGTCPDGDGPPFTLADLGACMLSVHEVIADEMFAVEYPQPTPTP